MQNGYELLKKWIEREGFCVIDEQVVKTYEVLKDNYHKEDNNNYLPTINHFYDFMINRLDRVLYYEAYLHPMISEIIVYLVVERLKKKHLYATLREVHSLCFSAQRLLENEIVENYTHAANFIVRAYQNDTWYENTDFIKIFEEYQEVFEL